MPIIVDHSADSYALRNIGAGVGRSVEQYRTNQLDKAANDRAERGMTLQEMAFQRLMGRDERRDMEVDRSFEYGQKRDQIGDQRYEQEMQYQKAQNAANFALRMGEMMDNRVSRAQQRKMTELQARLIMRQEQATNADRAYMLQRGRELGLDLQPGMNPQTMFSALQQAEAQAAQIAEQESAIKTMERLMVGGALSEQSAMMLTDMIEAGDIAGARRQMAGIVADAAEQQTEEMIRQKQLVTLTAQLDEMVQTTPMTAQQGKQLLSMFEVGLIDAEAVRKEMQRYDEFGVDGRVGRQGANIAGVSGRVDIPKVAIAPEPGTPLDMNSAAGRYWMRIAKQNIQPAKGEKENAYQQRVTNEAMVLSESEGGWGMPQEEQTTEAPKKKSGAMSALGSAYSKAGYGGTAPKPLFEGTIGANFARATEIIGSNFKPSEITPELADRIIQILNENLDKDQSAIQGLIKQLKNG